MGRDGRVASNIWYVFTPIDIAHRKDRSEEPLRIFRYDLSVLDLARLRSVDEYAKIDPFGARSQESSDQLSGIDHLWQDIEQILQMTILNDRLDKELAMTHP